MAFFKRRTFKTVGRDIGKSLERQKEKSKVVRTLEKEKEERDKEREINIRIQKLKEEKRLSKPSLIRGISKVAKGFGKKSKKRKAKKIQPINIKDFI